MNRALVFSAMLSLGALGLASPALASNAGVPDATSSVGCSSNNPAVITITDTFHCSLQGASATVSPFPYIGLSAQIFDDPQTATQNAAANMTYHFRVTGGPDGVAVPIIILSSLLVDANVAGALATLDSGAFHERVCMNMDNCGDAAFSDPIGYSIDSGAIGTVSLGVLVEVGFFNGGRGFASADPLIEIDPTFDNAAGYRIEVSGNVANALPPGVPEPAAWSLMLGGFALAGAALRRRRTMVISA